MAAGVARLRRVCRIHKPYREPGATGFVLNAPGETCERPVMKAAVHERAVVETFVDVRQVLQNDNWALELSSVLDSTGIFLKRFLGAGQQLIYFANNVENQLLSVRVYPPKWLLNLLFQHPSPRVASPCRIIQ